MNMAMLRERVRGLRETKAGYTVEEIEGEVQETSGTEPGLMYPGGKRGVHLRDDGVAEMYAGQARCMLDEQSGAALLTGSSVVIAGAHTVVRAGDITKLLIQGRTIGAPWFFGELSAVYNKKDLNAETYTDGAGVPKPFSWVFGARRLYDSPNMPSKDASRLVLMKMLSRGLL